MKNIQPKLIQLEVLFNLDKFNEFILDLFHYNYVHITYVIVKKNVASYISCIVKVLNFAS